MQIEQEPSSPSLISDGEAIHRFLLDIPLNQEFVLVVSESLARREFISTPEFIGICGHYDSELRRLDFQYDGSDPDFWEHLYLNIDEILSVESLSRSRS